MKEARRLDRSFFTFRQKRVSRRLCSALYSVSPPPQCISLLQGVAMHLYSQDRFDSGLELIVTLK